MEYDEIFTQNMDPMLIKKLMELGIIPEQQTQNSADLMRQQALQDASGPQGRTVREGIYQAANPLEHIGSVAQKFKARSKEEELRQTAELLRNKQISGRSAFFRHYTNPSLQNPATPGINPMAEQLRRGRPY